MKKKNLKHICILSDCYIPRRNSAAGMIYNLSRAFCNDGYEVTCIFGGINPVEYQYINPNSINAYDLKNMNFINSKFCILLFNTAFNNILEICYIILLYMM